MSYPILPSKSTTAKAATAKQAATPTVDVCELVYDALYDESQPFEVSNEKELEEVMDRIRSVVDCKTFARLDDLLGFRYYELQQKSFELGWRMRGQV